MILFGNRLAQTPHHLSPCIVMPVPWRQDVRVFMPEKSRGLHNLAVEGASRARHPFTEAPLAPHADPASKRAPVIVGVCLRSETTAFAALDAATDKDARAMLNPVARRDEFHACASSCWRAWRNRVATLNTSSCQSNKNG